jgi:hypothetical protein
MDHAMTSTVYASIGNSDDALNELERWLPMPDWETVYEVSSIGRVRSTPGRLHSGIVLKQPRRKTGGVLYRQVTLTHSSRGGTYGVHRLICRAFHGEPATPDLQTRHLDGDGLNNTVENLAWGTAKENAQDAIRHGTHISVQWARRRLAG